jgi:hypothetical protein
VVVLLSILTEYAKTGRTAILWAILLCFHCDFEKIESDEFWSGEGGGRPWEVSWPCWFGWMLTERRKGASKNAHQR